MHNHEILVSNKMNFSILMVVFFMFVGFSVVCRETMCIRSER